jgi:hypothetical protein
MFTTRGKAELTKTAILQRVSELDIFKYYCSSFSQVGKKFPSELRNDNYPSCSIIQMPSGVYIYKDFAESGTHTCFTYVQSKFFCTEEEALNIICNDFNLTKVVPIRLPPPSLNYVGLRDVPENRTITQIPIKKRSWCDQDTYWNRYHIPREMLDFYEVVPLQNIWSKYEEELKVIYYYKPSDPAYSYEHGNGMRKILRPNVGKELKWMSNLPRNVYSGWKQLDETGDILIITKSLKDVMIWRMAEINGIAPQSESVKPTEGFVNLLKSKYSRIYTNFDPDPAGIKGKEAWEEFGISGFNVPEKKDISDLVEARGFDLQQIRNLIPNA